MASGFFYVRYRKTMLLSSGIPGLSWNTAGEKSKAIVDKTNPLAMPPTTPILGSSPTLDTGFLNFFLACMK
jgi:hypothetical protein